jgi:phosphoribosyl 1,2-cyclic phosphodiesterase
MIRLFALGSGSKGNAFALETEAGTLLLDAGLSAREWLRRARTVGLEPERLVGIALTHEHGDHAGGATSLARKFGVPLVATEGTLRALGASRAASVTLRGSSLVEVGPFTVASCRLLHDAAEPSALVVDAAGVRVGLAYDFGRPTGGLRYLFRGLDAVILEANYDEVLLRTSDYPASVQHRIAGSGGHLSNTGAADLLGDLLHDTLRLVVLAHLSQQCNTPEVARAAIEPRLRARGFRGDLAVAVQDRPIGPIILEQRPRRHATQVELDFEPATSEPDPDRAGPERSRAAGLAGPPA